ncbi:hypothetical protein TruAng_009559 [Truncatella angustata]|nr:hypothetical protein TruAng_009559 [Truncatella angustata]
MSGINITCSPANLEALTPQSVNYAYIESYWNSVNVTAMTKCCAPQPATQDGCYTWCRLKDDADISTASARESWEANFQDCLTREGRLASNESFVAPKIITVKNSKSNAASQVGTGVKGVVLVGLGVLSWVLA